MTNAGGKIIRDGLILGYDADDRSMKLYKNGVQVGNTYTYDYNFTSTNFLIGTNHSAFYEVMHGNISQYKQYSRALPISEIQTLFNNEKSRYGL